LRIQNIQSEEVLKELSIYALLFSESFHGAGEKGAVDGVFACD
jgi:hypothetical protein